MAFTFGCPTCGARFTVTANDVGTRIECPGCKQGFRVKPPAQDPNQGPSGTKQLESPSSQGNLPEILNRVTHGPRESQPAVDVGAWLKWVVRGVSPDHRSLQQEAADCEERLIQFSQWLIDYPIRTSNELAQQVEQLRKTQADQLLQQVPVDRLADSILYARLKALKQAGYSTVAQLRTTSEDQLQGIYGIGPATAKQIAVAVSRLVQEYEGKPIRLPPPNAVNQSHQAVLLAACHRVRANQIPLDLPLALQSAALQIRNARSQSGQYNSVWKRIVSSPAKAGKISESHTELLRVLKSDSVVGALSRLDEVEKLLRVPDTFGALVRDYENHFADYWSVLEDYLVAENPTSIEIEARNDRKPEVSPTPKDDNYYFPSGSPRATASDLGLPPLFDSKSKTPPKAEISADRGTASHSTNRKQGGLPEQIASQVERVALDYQGMKVKLRGYQAFGAKYIVHQERSVLGDEMGLGKTIQALAAMTHLQRVESATHFVVVCPASVLENWVSEIQNRSSLKCFKCHGSPRYERVRQWKREGGIAVTSFSTLGFLFELVYAKVDFLVVDEAHLIKNSGSHRSRLVNTMAQDAKRVCLMTGTALENHLVEFVNLIRVCRQDLAQTLETQLRLSVRTPQLVEHFEGQVAQVYLRRNQEDVLLELPEALEVEEWVSLSDTERHEYLQAVRSENLMRMRQSANGSSTHSAKLKRLRELLEPHRQKAEKVVLFSYFLDTLSLLQTLVPQSFRIDGSVPASRRLEIINQFRETSGFAAMVCQIDAGGIGINLQFASAVFLVEPQYKPTTEWQAIKRVHRMGQSRRVMVYRMLVRDTVEESLRELVLAKSELFDEFARESAVKRATKEATATGEAEIKNKLLALEKSRLLAS